MTLDGKGFKRGPSTHSVGGPIDSLERRGFL